MLYNEKGNLLWWIPLYLILNKIASGNDIIFNIRKKINLIAIFQASFTL